MRTCTVLTRMHGAEPVEVPEYWFCVHGIELVVRRIGRAGWAVTEPITGCAIGKPANSRGGARKNACATIARRGPEDVKAELDWIGPLP